MNLAPPLFSVLPRSKASAALLAAAVVMATVATTLVAAVPMYSDAIIEAGLRGALADAPPAESGLEASFRADGSAWESTVARLDRIAADRLPGAFDTMNFARSDTYAFTELSAEEGWITSVGVLVADRELLAPVGPRGTAGAGAIAATLHRAAAEFIGAEVGDRIELTRRGAEPITVEIVALVEPIDLADDLWFDQPLLRDGLTTNASFTEVGPFLLDARDFAALSGTANYRWRVIVDPDSVTTGDVDRLRSGVAGMAVGIGDRIDVSSIEVVSELPALLAATDIAIGSTAAVVAAILLQLVGVALYGVGLAASVLVSSRAVETSMLRSRGATPEQLGAMAAVEAVLIAVPAVVLGPLLGARVVELVERWGPVASTGLDLRPTQSAAAVGFAVTVGVVVVAVVTWPAVRSARGFARSQQVRARPEGPLLLQRTGLDIGIVVLAVFGLWRLSSSSAATSDLAGRLGTDPVLVLAPTLGVIAASLLTLRLIAIVAAVSQRYTSSQGALSLALAGWELARRPGRTARTSVLVVLSVTVGAFAAVHGASWQRSQHDQADAAVSADVLIVPDARPAAPIPSEYLPAAYARAGGVAAVVPVDRPTASFSTLLASVPVVVTDTERLGDVLTLRDDLIGRRGIEAAARDLAMPGDIGALDLGDADGDLLVDFQLDAVPSDAVRDIAIVAQVIDGNGTFVSVRADGIALTQRSGTIRFPLTTTDVPGFELGVVGPLRLVELEVSAPSVREPGVEQEQRQAATFDLTLGPARIGDRTVSLGIDWVQSAVTLPNAVALPSAVHERTADALRIRLDTGLTQQVNADAEVRFGTAEFGTGVGFDVPVYVTPDVLTASALEVGDVATARVGGVSVDLRIAGTVTVVPFAVDESLAMLIDWETYNVDRWMRSRRTDTVDAWAVAIPEESADALRATVSGPPFSSAGFLDRRQRARDIARAPVTVGLAGSLALAIAASLIIAAIGLVLTAVVGARERRPAFAVLRALGTRAAELRRWLLFETLPLVGLSAVAGLASGIALARLALPSLAISTSGERSVPSPDLVVPWWTLAVVVAIAVAAGMALPVVTARLLRRHRTADELRIGDTS